MPLPRVIQLSNIAPYGFKIIGDAGDFAGVTVSSAGDINNDGYADILVSAAGNDSGGANAGATYVLFGKAGGFGTIDLATLSLADGFKIQGDAAGDGTTQLTSAGDVNNDGFDDFVVSTSLNDAGGANAGAAYVIFGKASGYAPIDLTILLPTDGYRILGHAGDKLGSEIHSYGDYNGDGFDDFILYTSDAGNTATAFSGTYLIYGKASGFATLDLHTLAPGEGFRLSNLGGAPAGDFNGDGIMDMVLGAPDDTSGGPDAGAAYLLFGKPGGFGDVNLAGLTPSDGFKMAGSDIEHAGWSVASAGDVNGDGFDDIVVGAPFHVTPSSTKGAAYIIFGKASGFGTINLASLAPADGFMFIGAEASLAGTSVSSAGDVNHDGYVDMLIGGDTYERWASSGKAYIVFGRPDGYHTIDVSFPGMQATDGIEILGGPGGDQAGQSVSAAGDVNGDGIDDIIVSANKDGQGGTFAGAAYVIFGVAVDLARLDAVTTDEAHLLNGDLFADNGSGADVNVDGGAVTVGAVNGYAANVGIEIALASGALLTVNADGTFTYDPNHVFDAMGGPGSGGSNTIYFDRFNYTLVGGSTAIVSISVTGVDSNDTLQGTPGNDNLVGGAGNDTIYAYGGNDQITGGAGADTMYGSTGNDSYYVDNAADIVIEAANEGFDVIWSSVSYILAAGTEVEALSTSSWEATTAINLTGNEIGNDIYGNAGANRLDGAGGADSLFGLEGNDMLIGGTGNDCMYGGAGDDFFFVDSLTDLTFENSGQGYDVVWSTVSYALAAGSEIEVLSSRFWESTDDLILVGSDLANTIYANAGDNVLNGHGGSDTLFGFGGEDSFLFDSALGPTNIDHIVDFSSAADTIVLDRAVFTTLSFGTLGPNGFHVGSAAHDSDDRIIYDSSNGAVYYDADGNGGGAAVLFAILQGAPTINSSDFFAI